MTSNALRWVPLILLALSTRAPAAECKLMELLKLPVTMYGEQPIVQAKIRGEDVTFLIDSGAFYSELTADSVARWKLRTRPMPFGMETRGIGGATEDSWMTTVDEMSLAGTQLHRVDFIVSEEGIPGGEAGLIGQNVLLGFDIDYDLANGVIRLMSPDDACQKSPLAWWAGDKPFSVIDIEPTTLRFPHARGTVNLNGRRVMALFDTGASVSMVDVAVARAAGVTPESPGARPADVIGGFGHGLVNRFTAPFDSLQIGDEMISHTRLNVGNLHAAGLNVGMVLGADFFLSHRVYVSNLQNRMYFTYSGGPVFDLSGSRLRRARADASGGATEPTEADGFARRGTVMAARGDYVSAIADLDRACEMAPTEAKYLALRADVKLRSGDQPGAKADLDGALGLQPEDIRMRLKRARLRIIAGQYGDAVPDLEAAAGNPRVTPSAALLVANLFIAAHRLDLAIAEYDRWIEANPEHGQRAAALTGRCRARALANRDLDRGLGDCDRAIWREGEGAGNLDSRGLVELRLGRFDRAIQDYDQALKLSPGQAWPLYGRGLAKLRKGRADEGRADIDAAEAADPKIAEEAAEFGVGP